MKAENGGKVCWKELEDQLFRMILHFQGQMTEFYFWHKIFHIKGAAVDFNFCLFSEKMLKNPPKFFEKIF